MNRLILILLLAMTSLSLHSEEYSVFVGTYTNNGRSKGVYRLRFDSDTGKVLDEIRPVALCSNPSFIAIHPTQGVLYAIGDKPASNGEVQAVVRCFGTKAMNAEGVLPLLGETSLGAIKGSTCHVILSPDSRALLLTHYGLGRVFSLPVGPDGRLGSLASSIVHEGKTGPNAQRQDRPHAHSFAIAPDSRFAFACDLGLDRIVRYAIEPGTARLLGTTPPYFASSPGVGPRHAKFSHDGSHFYVVNELAGSVDAFAYDSSTGGLTHLQTISTLAPGFSGENTSAEIQVHANDRYVYVSNRGPDTVTVFKRDPASGRLALVEIKPSGGKHPRHFALSPDGRFLFCSNRDSDNVVVFRISPETGRITQTPLEFSVPTPTCVLFAR